MLDKNECSLIKNAIAEAEKTTSGEIRVCIEKRCPSTPLDRASSCFHKFKMHKTALRNGVLIYVATQDRKFAIIGDAGINQLTGDFFWEETKLDMLHLFRDDKIMEGIVKGIEKVGQQLQTLFPFQKNDINELSDEVILLD